ncbi:mechanosensitive ion channel family protein [Candidatus Saccharibacteria bacterium]|nr:mechanosensitive ion channel family protein [Candidatus Saccharibacteria bacterium]
MDINVSHLWNQLRHYLFEPNFLRLSIVLVISAVVAYFASELLAKAIIKVAQKIAVSADNTSNEERQLKLRRVETYLGVIVALVRGLFVFFILYGVYRLMRPVGNSSVAAIGASAMFIVLAGATVGSILRDITAGATMIAEQWFNVGDHVRIEPFIDVGGVVERATLRSTKLRSLNGEVIWLHNQYIHAVKVTPRGLRTIAVDIFVTNETMGTKLVNTILQAIPTGPLMLARPLTITQSEAWGDELWHIEVIGQTPPGREWLIEDFFVSALQAIDEKNKVPVLVHKPLVRHADPDAERNFKRAVRVAKREAAKSK